MKKLSLFIATVIVFSSCQRFEGSGNIITEKRTPGAFKGVEAGGSFEVELMTGPEFKVEVEADDNLLKLIETRVSGDVLKIYTSRNSNIHDGHFKAFVTAPSFETIKASGAANIKGKNILKSANTIVVDGSGAGEINAELDAPEVEAEASGAADIQLRGRTRNFKGSVSGSGTLKTGELKSETADVKASGAGNAHVFSSVNFKGEASGAGTIYHSGGGAVQQKVTGAGTIKAE